MFEACLLSADAILSALSTCADSRQGAGSRTGALQQALERVDRRRAAKIRLHRLRLLRLDAADVIVHRHLPGTTTARCRLLRVCGSGILFFEFWTVPNRFKQPPQHTSDVGACATPVFSPLIGARSQMCLRTLLLDHHVLRTWSWELVCCRRRCALAPLAGKPCSS